MPLCCRINGTIETVTPEILAIPQRRNYNEVPVQSASHNIDNLFQFFLFCFCKRGMTSHPPPPPYPPEKRKSPPLNWARVSFIRRRYGLSRNFFSLNSRKDCATSPKSFWAAVQPEQRQDPRARALPMRHVRGVLRFPFVFILSKSFQKITLHNFKKTF